MNSSTFDKKNNKKNSFNNILEIIIMLIVAIIVLGTFITIYGLYLGSNAPVAVTTGSMEPVYGGYQKTNFGNYQDNYYNLPLEGDMLVLINRDPKLGDTIVYQEGKNTPIVHRIIAVREDPSGKLFYLTKGDYNSITDHSNHAWIAEEEVIGVVLLRFPMIGWLSLSIQGQAMRLFLLACLGIIFLLMLFEEEEENIDKDKNKKERRKIFGIIRINLKKFKPKLRNKKLWIKKLFSTPSGNLIVIFVVISSLVVGINVSAFFQESNGIEPTNFAQGYENFKGPPNDLEGIDSEGLYVIVYDLKIKSSGIFNWIHKIELRLNNTENEVAYVWDIPYSFNGDFSIKGAIPMSKGLVNGSGNYFLNLYFTIYSNGLFAQQTLTQNYQHSFTI